MFKNDFQGGSHFEVFSAQGKDPTSFWKLSGSGIKKVFDKEVKSFIYTIEGSTITTKMHLPKDSKQSAGLTQRFLVLQVAIPKGQDFSVDLGVSDHGSQKRHVMLSTTYKETQTNPLHSKIPLGFIRRAVWLNLCLDMISLVGETWHSQTYKCIDSICISANCRLRRIFTMKCQPADTTTDQEVYDIPLTASICEVDRIPRSCQLAPDVPQATQVINLTKVHYTEAKGKTSEATTARHNSFSDLDLSSSGGKRSAAADEYHIAFGTKMPGQPRRGSGKEGSLTSRHAKGSQSHVKGDGRADTPSGGRSAVSARGDGAVGEGGLMRDRQSGTTPGSKATHRERKNSDPGASVDDPELTVDKESLRTSHTWTDGADGQGEPVPFVKPHPPAKPSSVDRRRRKPRVKSAGQERTGHNLSGGTSTNGRLNPGSGQRHSRSRSGDPAAGTDLQQSLPQPQPSIMATEEEVELFMRQVVAAGSTKGHSRSESESEVSSRSTSHSHSAAQDTEDSLTEVIQTLNLGPHERLEYRESDGEDADEEEEADEIKIYTYSSPPKMVRDRGKLQNTLKANAEILRAKPKKKLTGAKHRKEAVGFRPSDSDSQNEADDPDDSASKSHSHHHHARPHHGASRRGWGADTSTGGHSRNRHSGARELEHGNQPPGAATGNHYQSPPPVVVIPPAGGALAKSPYNSQTRMSISRKSLREIPRDELRKSGSQKPYNVTKYQMSDLSESFEARMLLSLKRAANEDGGDSEGEGAAGREHPPGQDQHPPGGRPPSVSPRSRHHFNEESFSASSDDTETSTLKAPMIARLNSHNYQDEMKVLTQEFLTQSNPRDWGNVFSPPIVLPSTGRQETSTASNGDVTRNDCVPLGRGVGRGEADTDGEEELDLMYDPVLNCYFDPSTCKYYELC